MTESVNARVSSVEEFPRATRSTLVTDELNRLLTMLQERCPQEAIVSFDFDGKLHVHIDLRSREDVAVVEALLPTLGTGLFHSLSRGSTPNRPFFRRVTALVDR